MSSCLLGGFALGSKVHNPLKTTTLHFENLSWLPETDSLKLAQLSPQDLDKNQLKISVDFKPFELSVVSGKGTKKWGKRNSRKHASSWARLDHAIETLKRVTTAKQEQELFEDYHHASGELRRDFFASLVPTLSGGLANGETGSSKVPVSQAASTASETERNETTGIAKIEHIQYPASQLRSMSARSASPEAKVATHTVSNHQNRNHPKPVQARFVSIQQPDKKTDSPAPSDEQTEAHIQQELEQHALTGNEITAKIPEIETPEQAPAVSAPVAPVGKQEYAAYFQPELSKEQKKQLTEALLSEQMQTLQGGAVIAKSANPSPPQYASAGRTTASTPINRPNSKMTTSTALSDQSKRGPSELDTDTQSEDDAVVVNEGNLQSTASPNGNTCPQLAQTRFFTSVGSQICPTSQTWLSKNRAGRGWVKIENDATLPTLLYYPSPNTASALVLEGNSIAILGIKSGSRVMKGMGVIIGAIPEGYQAEFVGRAEEAQYFEVQGNRYFAILNAEPGAGVVQMISTETRAESTTVFAPVLEDTITYLDLVKPKPANFTVKVIKSGKSNDPDVAGLTVGVSTQGKIQGITQANGRAYLRNVWLVPGYPIFVDVSSKVDGNRSYTYRSILQKRNRLGDYLVYQIGEKTLHHWIQQVNQGLSDQSAMVVGLYDRTALGGFKEHYFAKVEPKTSKFGLEPLNFSILWDGKINPSEPLEGDVPRFMAVQVPEGLSQLRLSKESGEVVQSELIPVSPRVIHVVSQ